MKQAFIYLALPIILALSCSQTEDPASTTGSNSNGTNSGTTTPTPQVADCGGKTGFDKLVCLCDNFKASLSTSQLASVQLSYSVVNNSGWPTITKNCGWVLPVPLRKKC